MMPTFQIAPVEQAHCQYAKFGVVVHETLWIALSRPARWDSVGSTSRNEHRV